MILKDIHVLIAIGVIIVTAAGAVFGAIKWAIPAVTRRLKVLEDTMPKFVSQEEFEKVTGQLDSNCKVHRKACQALLCSRIDDVRGDLKTMDDKREAARFQAVPRSDFDQYKKEMKRHVISIESKINSQGDLLTRLDERVGLLLKANGIQAKI